MITKLGHFGLKIGALAAALALASPALAQNHGGGGGGGHFGGGGGGLTHPEDTAFPVVTPAL